MSQENPPNNIVSGYVDDLIGHLTFSNKTKYNALPQSAWQEIPFVVSRLCEDGARAIIVYGEGQNFCAGADISEFDIVRKNAETARNYEQTNVDAFAALRDAPVPVIAQIDGFCLGGGFGLAAACDIRVASESASFAVPAAKLGLAYPVEAMADIVQAIGSQSAKRLLFGAQRFTARQMLQMGFLLDVVSSDDLIESVRTIAKDIVELAPLTHRATKAAIAASFNGNTKHADAMGSATFTSKDYAEGRAAFREKRKPIFNAK